MISRKYNPARCRYFRAILVTGLPAAPFTTNQGKQTAVILGLLNTELILIIDASPLNKLTAKMSASSKRRAQSPLDGEGSDNKRRNILDDPPPLISLEEIPEDDSLSDAEADLTLKSVENKTSESQQMPAKTLTTDEKVDRLVDRMDRFFECFQASQKLSRKDQRSNTRKFKHLEQAHNDLISKVVDSASVTDARLNLLEERLAQSEATNKDLTDKIATLETNQERQVSVQHSINIDNTKKMSNFELKQDYTDRNVLDLAAEVKERKIIISRAYESRNEDVFSVALECINKVINAAIANLPPDAGLDGLRILMPQSLDNVYRIGKPKAYGSRNISVTFLRKDEKEMVCRARSATKDNEEIRFFISDDLSQDGRSLKAELRRISTVAKFKGYESKVTGNRVVIDSRPYASNELALIPRAISCELKQEKQVEGGIAYRGDRTIFSNFFPAPFNLDGTDYVHSEQYYQYHKATHHGEDDTAERILKLTNPWRIKVLGDNIEPDSEWISKRMRVMYEANFAKFKQNWPLQEELLKTKGLKLYEATTDMYWACGVGYDSNRWMSMDWKGENVAGLIVMKVRDELLDEAMGSKSVENTLTGIACDNNDSMNMSINHGDCPLESTMIHRDQQHMSKSSSSARDSLHEPLYTDVIKSHSRSYDEIPQSQRGYSTYNRRGGSNRGRGRGRSPRYHFSPAPKKQYNDSNRGQGHGRRPNYRGNYARTRQFYSGMSRDEMDFLYSSTPAAPTQRSPDKEGYVTPRKTYKSPSGKSMSPNLNQKQDSSNDVVKITEHQRLGLIELGLLPDSDFVKNIVSTAKVTTSV